VELLLHALVTPADAQDSDGGLMVLSTLFGQFPSLKKLFANTAYAGPMFQDSLTLAMPGLATAVVRRCDRANGFVVLSQRGIVERMIGRLNRCRRLAKDGNATSGTVADTRSAISFTCHSSFAIVPTPAAKPHPSRRRSTPHNFVYSRGLLRHGRRLDVVPASS
jgi:transposase